MVIRCSALKALLQDKLQKKKKSLINQKELKENKD